MCVWLPCLSTDWGVEQGLTGGDTLMGDTPATRLRGGAGEEQGEGLDRQLRHLETGAESHLMTGSEQVINRPRVRFHGDQRHQRP